MTAKELTEIVNANTVAIHEINKTLAEINKTQAENAQAMSQLTNNTLTLYDSIKSLETVAETLLATVSKHDEVIVNLEKQWQAYINTLPKT